MRSLIILCAIFIMILYAVNNADELFQTAQEKLPGTAPVTTAPTAAEQDIPAQDITPNIPLQLFHQDLKETSEPPDPTEGSFVLWLSNGEGAGDKGNIMLKANSSGVIKTETIVDFSQLDKEPTEKDALDYLEKTL